jgi:PAT family beta-lactamase induction signal transducer AmpG
LFYPDNLILPAVPLTKVKADSVRQFLQDWNIINGHVNTGQETQEETIESSEMVEATPTIIQQFEEFIIRHFGEEKPVIAKDNAGNVGLIYFRLAREPGSEEEVVVTFGRSSGDKSISLDTGAASGSRIVFNRQNWNKPALALIVLDPKLDQESQAVFTAQAGDIPLAWMLTFLSLAAIFILFFIYHKFILPYPSSDKAALSDKSKNYLKEFIDTFVLFFKKERIWAILGFLLLFRLAESQIVKLASPFLLDTQEAGGLALTTGEVGLVYGTVGILALTIGGLLGGFVAARHGLKFWLWPMAIAINLPDIVYVFLSYTIPDDLLIINICVAIEQFGYGFGFTAYMLYMIYVSEGDHKTAHFAITTGFMALGMMIPGMVSGYIQELIGYKHFFIWVMIATIPSFLILKFVQIDPEFGKKEEELEQ